MSEREAVDRRTFLTEVSTAAGTLAIVLTGAGCSAGRAREPGRQGPAEPAKGEGGQGVKLGVGASLGGKRLFPDDNPWNRDISKEPVDPNSDVLIASIGADKGLHPDFGTTYEGAPLGIPYVIVPGDQKKVPIRFVRDGDESDPGPYPVPPDAPVEGGRDSKSDRHVVVLDRDNWKLYELIGAYPEKQGWRADSGAIFDLGSNKMRPDGWTSANAAGLPILAGLARYDEAVEQQAIRHALAFTCSRTRRAYVLPARHFASKSRDANLPPMGMRVRLKADYDISKFPPTAQVILTALKRYGMFLAQNGGDWYMNGAPDPRWKDEELSTLKRVKGHDLEVVRMGDVVAG
jgi:hypothetical protein